MDQIVKYIVRSIAVMFLIAMLFSCQGRINKVRELGLKNFSPATEETKVNVVYTDSGKVALKLRSPLILDFSNLDFPYRESPHGIEVDFFDKDNKKTTITPDYGMANEKTSFIDFKENVQMVMSDTTF